MRNLLIGAGVIAVVVAVILWRRGSDDPTPAAADAVTPTTRSPSPATPTPPQEPHAAPTRVRKLAAGERERLAAQIARAAQRRPAAAAAASPAPPPARATTDEVLAAMEARQQANREILPFMKECFDAELEQTGARALTVHATLTLINDADVGGLVEDVQLRDDANAPLSPELAECARETLMSLAVPPRADAGRYTTNTMWTYQKRAPAP